MWRLVAVVALEDEDDLGGVGEVAWHGREARLEPGRGGDGGCMGVNGMKINERNLFEIQQEH